MGIEERKGGNGPWSDENILSEGKGSVAYRKDMGSSHIGLLQINDCFHANNYNAAFKKKKANKSRERAELVWVTKKIPISKERMNRNLLWSDANV